MSLDIVFGAMIFSAFLAQILEVHVPLVVFVEVGLAIWVVYTWDHLNDAKVGHELRSFRHRFHRRYQKNLLISMIGALLLGAALVFFLPLRTIYLGVILSVGVLAYFAILQFDRKF
ncbi:MAG: hypothetical protein AAFO69_12060, partial [Bacteroidota bacterium]